ncbi:hypothetical protein NP233_g11097 [Leucocoprinus birnbaumii]|uniref:DNA 3'-5' helicase n=1 Tax=Leucocoprinus birnbaumii TaxID=56174 RepID=A0AAD5YR95_9AGAR|nr:hypothetical protein NP233_g11097 [Leucocoprinus birnbaumii]
MAVIINPEILMNNPHIEELWKSQEFISRLAYFVFDEAHCIRQWGGFRNAYRDVGLLKYLTSKKVPCYAASATLPQAILDDVISTLELDREKIEYVLRSNSRPDISLTVWPIVYASKSFKDLDFLLRVPRGRPPKFLVFFDNIKKAEQATKYLRQLLPRPLQCKIKYFHSGMSQEYCDIELEAFRVSETWGLCVTDAFGMGMDIPDVDVVVQWMPPLDMSTLWQRFGRGARGEGLNATAILLVNKNHTLEERLKAEARTRERELKKRKERANTAEDGSNKKKSGQRTCNQQLVEDETLSSVPSSRDEASDILDTVARQLNYARIDHADDKKKGVRSGVEVGLVMDHFINPLAGGYSCRREPLDVYFLNIKRESDDHIRCDPETTGGCHRCRPKSTPLCCDLCSSHSFTAYTVPFIRPTLIRRSRIPPFTMTSEDQRLADALRTWQQDKAVETMGPVLLRMYGSRYFMADSVVDRIVACCHYNKITSVEHLTKELDWDENLIQAHGPSLLSVIVSCKPPPLPLPLGPAQASNPNIPSASSSNAHQRRLQQPPGPRKPYTGRCGSCGKIGHRKTRKRCRNHPNYNPHLDKENELPPPPPKVLA